MRTLLVHCFIALVLLTQGVASASAASRMAAGELQAIAQLADLPPCHQHAAKAALHCCGSSACHCVMSCGGLPTLSSSMLMTLFQHQTELLADHPQSAVQTGHYGPPLRPPAALQS